MSSVPGTGRLVTRVVRQIARVAGNGLVAVAVLTAALFAVRSVRGAPEVAVGAEGTAPDFDLAASDGARWTLSSLRGRPVVLNFWATWCPPCRVELPSFASFARAHPDVTVLGLAVASGKGATLEAARRRLDIPYPVLVADAAVVDAYGASSLPTTVVLDADGRVVASWTGVVFARQLERAVARIGEPGSLIEEAP